MRKVGYLIVLSTLMLPACGSKLPSIKPFKMDIQQGNEVNSKMLLQLRPGMTKSQVRYIMGTPLVVDSFHDNRWYYFYAMRKQGQVTEKRSVILDFEKDALLRVRGDVAAEANAVANAEKETSTNVVAESSTTATEEKSEKSWWDNLKFWAGSNEGQEAPAVADASAPLVAPAAVVTETKSSEQLSEAETTALQERPVIAEIKASATPTDETATNAEAKPAKAATPEQAASAVVVTEAPVTKEATVVTETKPADTKPAEAATEVKPVEQVAEAKDSQTDKSWWQRLMFWKDDAKNAPATVAEEKPALPELKATVEPVLEAKPAEVATPEPAVPAPVVTEVPVTTEAPVVAETKPADTKPAKAATEVKPVEQVAEAKDSQTEKSWWQRLMFWKDDAKNAPATVAEEKPALLESKATVASDSEAKSAELTTAETVDASVSNENKLNKAPVTNTVPTVQAEQGVKNTTVTVASAVAVSAKEEIASAVASWAEAWRSKNLKAYLAKYAADFKPESLPNKNAWIAQRKQRLSPAQGKINLDISNIQVQQNGDQVSVQFLQKYASKIYRDQVNKQLDLRLDPASKKWLIVRETTTPAK